jgi:hypothetical protein
MNTLQETWIYPPLSFARVGSAGIPVDNFHWGPNDVSPRGTGKTTLVPAETLDIDATGTVTSRMPESIRFKEIVDGREAFRPVCPWLELHGRWLKEGRSMTGPITPNLLQSFGVALSDIRWTVQLANRKAYNMTLEPADIISAAVEIAGDDSTVKQLLAHSQGAKPLVLPTSPLRFGRVQLSRPDARFPELRLRFFPPAGVVYGPKSLRTKIAQHVAQFSEGTKEEDDRWQEFQIPESRLVLSDIAAWSNWVLTTGDARTVPVLQFAHLEGPKGTRHSLGLIDDFSDSLITCSIALSAGQKIEAKARVVVTPPDFAPDRRHVVSLADDLKDRVDRNVEATYRNIPLSELSLEMQDLFQRIWETMGLVNIDAMNSKRDFARNGQPPYAMEASSGPLPLTSHARRAHRRLAVLEALEDFFREREGRSEIGTIPNYPAPRSLSDLINAPPLADGTTPPGNAYRKMPALMRGSDGSPMTLTRRQYETLFLWISRLEQESGQTQATIHPTPRP